MKRCCTDPHVRRGLRDALLWGCVACLSLGVFAEGEWAFEIENHPADVVNEQTAALEEELDAWKSMASGARSLAVAVDTWDFTTISQEGLNLNTRPFAITIFIR